MTRIWMAAVASVLCGLLVAGCEKASSAAKKIEEGAKKAAGQAKEAAKEAKESAKEATEAAKVAVLKPIEEALPKIEEKIKGLKEESATKAKAKLEEFKKLLEQFKAAAPDKWEALKDVLGVEWKVRCEPGAATSDPQPVEAARRAEEDSMLAEAGRGEPADVPPRDPEEVALELLQNELGARRIDGG